MGKVLNQYWLHRMHRGLQFQVGVCSYTAKDAAKILDVSLYYLKTWATCMPAKHELGIKNPLLRLAKFERSGEFGYFINPDLFGKAIKYIDAIAIIDDHRKICKTYAETEKKYPKGKYSK